MRKAKTEQPTVEKIKLFESMNNLYLATNSEGFALAALTVTEGADRDDARKFAAQHVPGTAEVKPVVGMLYDTLNERRWQALLPDSRPRHKALSAEDSAREAAAVHRQIVNSFSKRFIGVPKHTANPLDPRKRAAYQEHQRQERDAAMARTKAGVVDGTAPELRKLLDEQKQLQAKIHKVREKLRLQRDAEFTRRRSEQKEGGLPS